MGAMFEDHTKVDEEDIKKAKEEAIKNNLGVEDIGIDNMSDEELDILLANSDSVNKKVEAIIHHFENAGEQKIVEEITKHTNMKFSEAMLAYESISGASEFFGE